MLTLYLTLIDNEDDKRTFEEIYHSFRKQMLMVALSILDNQSDAEDMVHDVFLKIASKHMNTIKQMKDDIDVRNYILKATKNTALNWNVKKSKELMVEDDETLEYLQTVHILQQDFVECLCDKVEYEQLIQALQQLDSKYRDVLYYHFILEFTVPKVAKLLNQSVATTKQQLIRGKKKLVYLLEREGENQND